MSKPTGAAVAARAVALATGPTIGYDELDCQAFIEQCVKDCGGRMAYAGSNDMARNAIVWMGTIANAKAEGKLVPGAGLMIHEDDESGLPAKYKGDGLGDFSHVGLYVGKNALEDVDKKGKRRKCDVVHSSSSMGRVAGSTLANGWTHLVLFKDMDYGMDATGLTLGAEAEAILNDETAQTGKVLNNEGELVDAPEQSYVLVTSANGGDVRIRERPERGAITKYSAPVGTRLLVMGEKNGYLRVMYKGKARWIDKKFTVQE